MQTELLKVTGMTCGGCTSTVTHALQAVTGVGDVNVSLSSGEAAVQYDERLTSPEQLKSAVTARGLWRGGRRYRPEIQRQGLLLRLTPTWGSFLMRCSGVDCNRNIAGRAAPYRHGS